MRVSMASIGLLLFLTTSTFSQQTSDLPTIKYMELINNESDYAGKRVRVSGYRRIFPETDVLYDPSDLNFRKYGAWLEFEGPSDQCRSYKKQEKKIGRNFIGDVFVVFTGKLQTGGGFGHMNGYKYQFVVDCIEEIAKLPRSQNQSKD